VDRDEGFWLYTSARVGRGELPYRDFALPHLPLASLLYAAAIGVLGPSLYGLRALNVVLFLGMGAWLAVAANKRLGHEAALTATTFYASSSLALTWLIPVKAYAPATAAITGACVLWLGREPGGDLAPGRAALIGLLLGLATLSRLTLFPTLAAAALVLILTAKKRVLAGVAALCLGFIIPVAAICLFFQKKAGTAFAFNVWGIHRLFLGDEPAGRARALAALLLPPDPALLIVLSCFAFTTKNARALALPAALGAAVVVANLAPGTTQVQYFAPAIPALAVTAGVAAATLINKRRYLGVALVALTAVIGVSRPLAKIVGDRAHKPPVGPAEVYAAAALLKERSAPDETVFTAWPGYAALAGRRVLAGWELDYFTARIGERTDAVSRRRYHLLSYDETAARLAAGAATTALTGLDADVTAALTPTLKRHFYPVARRRGVTVWKYRRPSER